MFDYLPQQALPYVVDIPHLTDGRRIGPDDETARDHASSIDQESTNGLLR